MPKKRVTTPAEIPDDVVDYLLQAVKEKEEEEIKRGRGRPTKLTHDFIEAAREFLEDDVGIANSEQLVQCDSLKSFNAVVMTDEELLYCINHRLDRENRVSKSTFETWKKLAREGDLESLGEVGSDFLGLIKRALIVQKNFLIRALMHSPQGWQRFAWIIQRKFEEWSDKKEDDSDKPMGTLGVLLPEENNSIPIPNYVNPDTREEILLPEANEYDR